MVRKYRIAASGSTTSAPDAGGEQLHECVHCTTAVEDQPSSPGRRQQSQRGPSGAAAGTVSSRVTSVAILCEKEGENDRSKSQEHNGCSFVSVSVDNDSVAPLPSASMMATGTAAPPAAAAATASQTTGSAAAMEPMLYTFSSSGDFTCPSGRFNANNNNNMTSNSTKSAAAAKSEERTLTKSSSFAYTQRNDTAVNRNGGNRNGGTSGSDFFYICVTCGDAVCADHVATHQERAGYGPLAQMIGNGTLPNYPLHTYFIAVPLHLPSADDCSRGASSPSSLRDLLFPAVRMSGLDGTLREEGSVASATGAKDDDSSRAGYYEFDGRRRATILASAPTISQGATAGQHSLPVLPGKTPKKAGTPRRLHAVEVQSPRFNPSSPTSPRSIGTNGPGSPLRRVGMGSTLEARGDRKQLLPVPELIAVGAASGGGVALSNNNSSRSISVRSSAGQNRGDSAGLSTTTAGGASLPLWSYVVLCSKCNNDRPSYVSSTTALLTTESNSVSRSNNISARCGSPMFPVEIESPTEAVRQLGNLMAILEFCFHRSIPLRPPLLYENMFRRADSNAGMSNNAGAVMFTNRSSLATSLSLESSKLMSAGLTGPTPPPGGAAGMDGCSSTTRRLMTSRTRMSTSVLTSPSVAARRNSNSASLSGRITSLRSLEQLQTDDVMAVCGVVGLRNISVYCYFNAVLQCVCHSHFFAAQVLNGSLPPAAMMEPITMGVSRLLQRQMSLTVSDVQSKALATIVDGLRAILQRTFSALMPEGEQQDAQEFFLTLTNGLEAEWKRHTAGGSGSAAAATKASKSTSSSTTPGITMCFEGAVSRRVACKSCGSSRVTSEPYMSLSVSMQQSVTDSVAGVFAKSELTGADRYACEECFRRLSPAQQAAHNEEARKVQAEDRRLTAERLASAKKSQNSNGSKKTGNTSTTSSTTSTVPPLTSTKKKTPETPLKSPNCIHRDATVSSDISRLGSILAIHLLRFTFSSKTQSLTRCMSTVAIPLQLSLAPYVNVEVQKEYARYDALRRIFQVLRDHMESRQKEQQLQQPTLRESRRGVLGGGSSRRTTPPAALSNIDAARIEEEFAKAGGDEAAVLRQFEQELGLAPLTLTEAANLSTAAPSPLSFSVAPATDSSAGSPGLQTSTAVPSPNARSVAVHQSDSDAPREGSAEEADATTGTTTGCGGAPPAASTWSVKEAPTSPWPSLERRLMGMVLHRGTTLDRGHYLAYIRTAAFPSIWFRCDDETVDIVDEAEVLKGGAEAYLLFYE